MPTTDGFIARMVSERSAAAAENMVKDDKSVTSRSDFLKESVIVKGCSARNNSTVS